MEVRRDRKYNWEFFFRHSKEFFSQIARLDPRIQEFGKLYSFVTIPGGRNGGRDRRMVEVFFGTRPFDREYRDRLGDEPGADLLILESGATLQYYRQDDDRVVVFLYPPVAITERNPSPNAYILDVIRHTHVLTGTGRLKRHLRYLLATMETYSIDANPTLIDRAYIFWMQKTKYHVIGPKEALDDRQTAERPMKNWGRFIWEALVSALSGWLLGTLPWFWKLIRGK